MFEYSNSQSKCAIFHNFVTNLHPSITLLSKSTYPIARWYSRFPKFVCGTINPILKCCCVLSCDGSVGFVWCSCLWLFCCFRCPTLMPDCCRNAKVIPISHGKMAKMYDVFIIAPLSATLPMPFEAFSVLCNNCRNPPRFLFVIYQIILGFSKYRFNFAFLLSVTYNTELLSFPNKIIRILSPFFFVEKFTSWPLDFTFIGF